MAQTLKVVLLSLLLIFTGVAGAAQLVCTAPTGMQAHHACCMHHGADMGKSQTRVSQDGVPSCCKVKPVVPNPMQTVFSSSSSTLVVDELTAATIAATIPPFVLHNRERLTGHLSKDLNSPTRAALCSFLI
jgi:hypothetical protein